MKKSIIEDIYYGNNRCYNTVKTNKAYWEFVHKYTELSNRIENNLTAQ